MTTNKPVELGKASDETKEKGFVDPDSINMTLGPATL
jgi:hypothetical protein